MPAFIDKQLVLTNTHGGGHDGNGKRFAKRNTAPQVHDGVVVGLNM